MLIKTVRFLVILLIISGCKSISSRIESFTMSVKNNPEIIRNLTKNTEIVLHDSLQSAICKHKKNLDSLYNQINIFYKSNETDNRSVIKEKWAFYKNPWRRKFNLDSFEYYWIAYCKEKMRRCLIYEFLIDKDKNLILFDIYIDILR